jgi:hypothetical protein
MLRKIAATFAIVKRLVIQYLFAAPTGNQGDPEFFKIILYIRVE